MWWLRQIKHPATTVQYQSTTELATTSSVRKSQPQPRSKSIDMTMSCQQNQEAQVVYNQWKQLHENRCKQHESSAATLLPFTSRPTNQEQGCYHCHSKGRDLINLIFVCSFEIILNSSFVFWLCLVFFEYCLNSPKKIMTPTPVNHDMVSWQKALENYRPMQPMQLLAAPAAVIIL